MGKLAASRHGGIVTDTRPSFDPSPVDFGTVTSADVYIDMAHASNKKTWLDIRMDISIEYSSNKGLYIYSMFGNRDDSNRILGRIIEKHKIVYLEKKDNSWTIERGFLYEYSYQPHSYIPIKIKRQIKNDSGRTYWQLIEINNLCDSYYSGCGNAQENSTSRWSGHFSRKSVGSGQYRPLNPFSLKDQSGYEFNPGWKWWYWSSNARYFHGFYDKHSKADNKWKIPRYGMFMWWSKFNLVKGEGDWDTKCSNTDGTSCGLNSTGMYQSVSQSS